MIHDPVQGRSIDELSTPALLIDADKFSRNINLMSDITAAASVPYRPHVKSHKCSTIARLQIKAGARGVCCATVNEAEAMVANGIGDVHITSEIADRTKISRVLALAARAEVSLVIDDESHIAMLESAARDAGVRLSVLIEVDVGQGRCGVAPGQGAARLAARIANSRCLQFRGLQGFQGKLQMIVSLAERKDSVKRALDQLLQTAEFIRLEGLPVDVLTGGGTGSLTSDINFGGLNELQPGSYVFMDSQYRGIEWPDSNAVPFENSLTILATVVSRPSKDRAIVDVGLKAASVDHGPPQPLDLQDAVFSFGGDEHGQLSFSNGSCPLTIGDKVRLLPSHCDTTANLYDSYAVVRSDLVEDWWKIDARGYRLPG